MKSSEYFPTKPDSLTSHEALLQFMTPTEESGWLRSFGHLDSNFEGKCSATLSFTMPGVLDSQEAITLAQKALDIPVKNKRWDIARTHPEHGGESCTLTYCNTTDIGVSPMFEGRVKFKLFKDTLNTAVQDVTLPWQHLSPKPDTVQLTNFRSTGPPTGVQTYGGIRLKFNFAADLYRLGGANSSKKTATAFRPRIEGARLGDAVIPYLANVDFGDMTAAMLEMSIDR